MGITIRIFIIKHCELFKTLPLYWLFACVVIRLYTYFFYVFFLLIIIKIYCIEKCITTNIAKKNTDSQQNNTEGTKTIYQFLI